MGGENLLNAGKKFVNLEELARVDNALGGQYRKLMALDNELKQLNMITNDHEKRLKRLEK